MKLLSLKKRNFGKYSVFFKAFYKNSRYMPDPLHLIPNGLNDLKRYSTKYKG